MPDQVDQAAGDITDPEALKRAVAGAGTVVCAVSGFGGIEGANFEPWMVSAPER